MKIGDLVRFTDYSDEMLVELKGPIVRLGEGFVVVSPSGTNIEHAVHVEDCELVTEED